MALNLAHLSPLLKALCQLYKSLLGLMLMVRSTSPARMGLRPDTAFACAMEFLFEPRQEIKTEHAATIAALQDAATLKIGIQVGAEWGFEVVALLPGPTQHTSMASLQGAANHQLAHRNGRNLLDRLLSSVHISSCVGMSALS